MLLLSFAFKRGICIIDSDVLHFLLVTTLVGDKVVCFNFSIFSRADDFILPVFTCPLEIMNVFQTWDFTNNLHFVPLQLGVWVILDLVCFLVFWRTLCSSVAARLVFSGALAPMEVLKRLCSGLQHGEPVSLLVFVGWARSRLLGQNVCLCPELSVKDRLSWTCCFRVILGVYDWSPWCSSWEDTMCVFRYDKESRDRSGRCWRFWDDFRAWISVIIYSPYELFQTWLAAFSDILNDKF